MQYYWLPMQLINCYLQNECYCEFGPTNYEDLPMPLQLQELLVRLIIQIIEIVNRIFKYLFVKKDMTCLHLEYSLLTTS